MSEGEHPGSDDAREPTGATPPLDESIRAIGAAGRATLSAHGDSLRALRALFSADVALARSALGRGLAWAGVAVVFGASAWLLATAAGVALMQRLGLSWLASLSVAALFNLAITGLAAWRTSRFFDYMGLHATRRQLSRMGLFDEHGGDDDGDGPEDGDDRGRGTGDANASAPASPAAASGVPATGGTPA